jgi:hypothetical protein
MKLRTFFSAEFIADICRADVREPVRNPEVSPDCQTNSRLELFLTAAIFVLGKTILAIHRTIFSWFERDFALLFAIGTDRLMHFSGTSIVSSILKSHIILLSSQILIVGYTKRMAIT